MRYAERKPLGCRVLRLIPRDHCPWTDIDEACRQISLNVARNSPHPTRQVDTKSSEVALTTRQGRRMSQPHHKLRRVDNYQVFAKATCPSVRHEPVLRQNEESVMISSPSGSKQVSKNDYSVQSN